MVEKTVPRPQLRVAVLEQILHLVLAPLYSLASWVTEHELQGPSSLLAHPLQQQDHISSLPQVLMLKRFTH